MTVTQQLIFLDYVFKIMPPFSNIPKDGGLPSTKVRFEFALPESAF